MKLSCPRCGDRFRMLMSNAKAEIAAANPPVPVLCSACLEVCLWDGAGLRLVTESELAALKKSPAWRDVIEPAIEIIRKTRRMGLQ